MPLKRFAYISPIFVMTLDSVGLNGLVWHPLTQLVCDETPTRRHFHPSSTHRTSRVIGLSERRRTRIKLAISHTGPDSSHSLIE